MLKKFLVILWASVLVVGSSVLPASAEGLPKPEGDVILTVTGDITETNSGNAAEFDLAMLEELPSVEFTTNTIWTEGPQTFKGVQLKDFLEIVGARGEVLEALAINDYAINIPAEDAVEGGAILAYMLNGSYMPRREKGPLWVVYPYDSNIDYRSETTYSRSIWQLDRLIAE